MFCFFLCALAAASQPSSQQQHTESTALTTTTTTTTTPRPLPTATRPVVQLQQNFAIVNIIEKCNVSSSDVIYTHIDGTRYVVIRSLSRVSERVYEQKTDVMCLPGDVYDFAAKNEPFAMLDCYACMKEDVEKIGAASAPTTSKAETVFEIVGFVLGVVGMAFTTVSAVFTIYRHFRQRRGTRNTVPRNAPKANELSDADSVEEVAS